jgi:hypothetical protein
MAVRRIAPWLSLALLVSLASAVAAADSPWGAWQFLIGEWQGTADGTARANYFDNEGHVISYEAKPSADGKSIALVSVEPVQPRFRLTYSKRDDGQVGIRFEIAPSGKVEELKTYLEGTVKRVSAGSPGAPGRE